MPKCNSSLKQQPLKPLPPPEAEIESGNRTGHKRAGKNGNGSRLRRDSGYNGVDNGISSSSFSSTSNSGSNGVSEGLG